MKSRTTINPLMQLLAIRITRGKLEHAMSKEIKYKPIANNKCHQLSHFVSDVKAFEATNNSF
jgi:hypothetical protein